MVMITVKEAMQRDVIKFKDVDTISYVANALREKEDKWSSNS